MERVKEDYSYLLDDDEDWEEKKKLLGRKEIINEKLMAD